MSNVEKNINKRALIYGISIIGSGLIIGIGLATILFFNEVLGFVMAVIAGWAWWNYIHSYIFKGISYGGHIAYSLLFFLATSITSSIILASMHKSLSFIFGGHSQLHDIAIIIMVLSAVYITVIEIGIFIFQSANKT